MFVRKYPKWVARIIFDDGSVYFYDGVKDMFKHIFMDYLRLIALDRALPLCEACRALHPSRMLGSAAFTQTPGALRANAIESLRS